MKKSTLHVIFAAGLLLLGTGLAVTALIDSTADTVPFTGRHQPDGLEAIEKEPNSDIAPGILSQLYIVKDHREARCKRILNDLVLAAGLGGETWDLQVYDNVIFMANAIADFPTRHVLISTKFLKSMITNDVYAVVIGHEIAHVLARHTAEHTCMVRNGDTTDHTMEIECEADRIGLILMAKAGYDPRAAIRLWSRVGRSENLDILFPGIVDDSQKKLVANHLAERLVRVKTVIPEALRYQGRNG